MKTIRLSADHGFGEFIVKGIQVGKLCAHHETNGPMFRVAHAATLFALPGFFTTMDAAVSAAKELDGLADWDAIASVLSPTNSNMAERRSQDSRALYTKCCQTVTAHGGFLSISDDVGGAK